MLHLTKLGVGVRDVEHMRAMQAERVTAMPPLRHRTRNCPRRSASILDGGSIYWVINGVMQVRQRILEIREDSWEDGSKCAALILDPALVMVAARPTKPFQGWRYLESSDAPLDIVKGRAAEGESALPPALRQELQALCLI